MRTARTARRTRLRPVIPALPALVPVNAPSATVAITEPPPMTGPGGCGPRPRAQARSRNGGYSSVTSAKA